MKKRTSGHEKHIIRERVKSCALAVLCLCCAYLLIKVFGLQGVKSGTAFEVASDIRGAADNSSRNIVKEYSALTEPDLITVNNKNSHTAISEGDADYTKVIETVNEILKSSHEVSAQSISTAEIAQWKEALSGKSLYVHYPCVRSAEFDARFYEIKSGELAKKIPEYSEIVITTFENNGANVMLRHGDNIVSVKTEDSVATLSELTEKLYEDAYAYKFGFELGENAEFAKFADKIDPYLVFPIGEYFAEKICVDIPWEYKNSVEITKTTSLTNGLIDLFGYNLNTVRRYVDGDGALVCVGETGTLRMCHDGTIEYRALDSETGVSLLASGNSDFDNTYTMTAGLIGVIERIFELCGEGANSREYKLRFTEMSQADGGEKIIFGLDFFVDGNMLCVREGHAIEAVVQYGILTEMKMCVKSVERTGERASAGEFFDAVEANTQSGKSACAAYVCYVSSEDGSEYLPTWKISDLREVSR